MRKEPEKALSRQARNCVDLIRTCGRLMPDKAVAACSTGQGCKQAA
jgi:hypothetical protein